MVFESMCWGLWTVVTLARKAGVSKSRLKQITDVIWLENQNKYPELE